MRAHLRLGTFDIEVFKFDIECYARDEDPTLDIGVARIQMLGPGRPAGPGRSHAAGHGQGAVLGPGPSGR